jgi:rare lipoprotein A
MQIISIVFLLCLLAGCATTSVVPTEYSSLSEQTNVKEFFISSRASGLGMPSSSTGKFNKAKAARTSKLTKVVRIKDGAPKARPLSFKEVKPKNEPFSRYGNPESYAVDGHTYQIMRSATGYKIRGIASWYGTKFHRKRTSSGDHYDMYAMTAAHKTLPLPTYVRVKNLHNGRVAVVKINDRGPFHQGRVIDLSYAAATKLGLLPKGTAPVEVEALTTGKHVAHYYLQAGAFNSEKLANRLQSKLAKLTPSPVTIEKHIARFIVKVGPFANKGMTDNLKSKLAANGVRGAFAFLQ